MVSESSSASTNVPNQPDMRHGPNHPWYDDARAPIIEMHLPPVFSNEELEAALEAVKTWLLEEVNAPFGFVVHLEKPFVLSSLHRQMMAQYEKSYAHVDRKYNVAQAVIVPTTFARRALQAIYWLSPPVYPVRTFRDADAAWRWVESQLGMRAARHRHRHP